MDWPVYSEWRHANMTETLYFHLSHDQIIDKINKANKQWADSDQSLYVGTIEFIK